jgi:hypothetical protein
MGLVMNKLTSYFRMTASVTHALENNTDVVTACNLGYKNLKPMIPKWVACAWESVPTDSITNGWTKLGIHDCWTSTWQDRAEQERERLSKPVTKKNAKPKAGGAEGPTNNDMPPLRDAGSEDEDDEELSEEPVAAQYVPSASSEEEQPATEVPYEHTIEAFMERARRRERGCLSPCACEKRIGTSKCLCEKKGGCGPNCQCDPAKCRKKRGQ